MNATAAEARGIGARPRRLSSPIEDFLAELHARISEDRTGEVATYIPELGRADPDALGIAVATIDGKVYEAGDSAAHFTIQSVSKPFMYGYALREYGRDAVLEHVGVEPTGEAFNSIILDDVHNRPFNPMVNAGAIAIAEHMKGETREDREREMLDLFGQFAGRPLDIDEAVFRSEHLTGHRNRAIAYMMLNTGMIQRAPDDVLDLYFKQCSVRVTTRDLAVMAATLANHGVNPLTGATVLGPEHVRDVLTLMNSCGMYNYAGQWAYEVGMPAKSGVSGGIIAVIPGQAGLAVYGPPLDVHGNSIRGVRVCKEFSAAFGLHVFRGEPSTISVIRSEYRGGAIRSKRRRTPREAAILDREAGRIAILELQSVLYFGSVERVIRRVAELADGQHFVVVDFKRVETADAPSVRLLGHLAEALGRLGCRAALTGLPPEGRLAGLRAEIESVAERAGVRLLDEIDQGLELFEDAILGEVPEWQDRTRFALAQMEIFRGLTPAEYRALEQIIQAFQFGPGEVIIREGDEARLLFVMARGSASVHLALPEERSRRVACIGPGLTFGEMALIDGGRRSANVVADESVICYGLSVDRLRELAVDQPNILITILGNLARDLSERLRRANDEIRALE